MSDSTQGEFGEETFAFTFPLWLIREPGIHIEGIKFAAVAGKIGIPIFTDEDLAQRMLDTAPRPNSYILESLTHLAFFGLVVLLEQKGVAYVLIDPTGPKGKSGAFPIAIVREYAAKWFD